jgi:hypothetical protein
MPKKTEPQGKDPIKIDMFNNHTTLSVLCENTNNGVKSHSNLPTASVPNVSSFRASYSSSSSSKPWPGSS